MTSFELESKLAALGTNPERIDLSAPVVFYIRIRDVAGSKKYRYVGGTKRYEKNLGHYKKNMRRIRDGKPRRKTCGQEPYRAVHFVLYKALQENWEIDFYPLTSCASEDLRNEKNDLLKEHSCNLSGAQMWRIEDLASTTIEGLGIEPTVLKYHP